MLSEAIYTMGVKVGGGLSSAYYVTAGLRLV